MMNRLKKHSKHHNPHNHVHLYKQLPYKQVRQKQMSEMSRIDQSGVSFIPNALMDYHFPLTKKIQQSYQIQSIGENKGRNGCRKSFDSLKTKSRSMTNSPTLRCCETKYHPINHHKYTLSANLASQPRKNYCRRPKSVHSQSPTITTSFNTDNIKLCSISSNTFLIAKKTRINIQPFLPVQIQERQADIETNPKDEEVGQNSFVESLSEKSLANIDLVQSKQACELIEIISMGNRIRPNLRKKRRHFNQNDLTFNIDTIKFIFDLKTHFIIKNKCNYSGAVATINRIQTKKITKNILQLHSFIVLYDMLLPLTLIYNVRQQSSLKYCKKQQQTKRQKDLLKQRIFSSLLFNLNPNEVNYKVFCDSLVNYFEKYTTINRFYFGGTLLEHPNTTQSSSDNIVHALVNNHKMNEVFFIVVKIAQTFYIVRCVRNYNFEVQLSILYDFSTHVLCNSRFWIRITITSLKKSSLRSVLQDIYLKSSQKFNQITATSSCAFPANQPFTKQTQLTLCNLYHVASLIFNSCLSCQSQKSLVQPQPQPQPLQPQIVYNNINSIDNNHDIYFIMHHNRNKAEVILGHNRIIISICQTKNKKIHKIILDKQRQDQLLGRKRRKDGVSNCFKKQMQFVESILSQYQLCLAKVFSKYQRGNLKMDYHILHKSFHKINTGYFTLLTVYKVSLCNTIECKIYFPRFRKTYIYVVQIQLYPERNQKSFIRHLIDLLINFLTNRFFLHDPTYQRTTIVKQINRAHALLKQKPHQSFNMHKKRTNIIRSDDLTRKQFLNTILLQQDICSKIYVLKAQRSYYIIIRCKQTNVYTMNSLINNPEMFVWIREEGYFTSIKINQNLNTLWNAFGEKKQLRMDGNVSVLTKCQKIIQHVMFAIDYFADSLRDLAEYFKARLEVDKNNGTIDNKTIQMQGKIQSHTHKKHIRKNLPRNLFLVNQDLIIKKSNKSFSTSSAQIEVIQRKQHIKWYIEQPNILFAPASLLQTCNQRLLKRIRASIETHSIDLLSRRVT